MAGIYAMSSASTPGMLHLSAGCDRLRTLRRAAIVLAASASCAGSLAFFSSASHRGRGSFASSCFPLAVALGTVGETTLLIFAVVVLLVCRLRS